MSVVLRVDNMFTDILHEPLLEPLRLDVYDLGLIGRPLAEVSRLLRVTAADARRAG